MRSKPLTVTRVFARELKRIDERMSRGHWVPFAVVRQQMLDDMATELRRLARAFAQTRRGGKDLLEKLVIAEVEGVDPGALAKVRHKIGEAVAKRIDAETALLTEESIRTTPFTLTREEAKNLKRIIERISNGGRTIPHEVVRQEWLDDMATELQELARTYGRTGRGARHLLEYLAMAENEGTDAQILAKIRRDLGQRVMKRRAA